MDKDVDRPASIRSIKSYFGGGLMDLIGAYRLSFLFEALIRLTLCSGHCTGNLEASPARSPELELSYNSNLQASCIEMNGSRVFLTISWIGLFANTVAKSMTENAIIGVASGSLCRRNPTTCKSNGTYSCKLLNRQGSPTGWV